MQQALHIPAQTGFACSRTSRSRTAGSVPGTWLLQPVCGLCAQTGSQERTALGLCTPLWRVPRSACMLAAARRCWVTESFRLSGTRPPRFSQVNAAGGLVGIGGSLTYGKNPSLRRAVTTEAMLVAAWPVLCVLVVPGCWVTTETWPRHCPVSLGSASCSFAATDPASGWAGASATSELGQLPIGRLPGCVPGAVNTGSCSVPA